MRHWIESRPCGASNTRQSSSARGAGRIGFHELLSDMDGAGSTGSTTATGETRSTRYCLDRASPVMPVAPVDPVLAMQSVEPERSMNTVSYVLPVKSESSAGPTFWLFHTTLKFHSLMLCLVRRHAYGRLLQVVAGLAAGTKAGVGTCVKNICSNLMCPKIIKGKG